jgi:hypothetical protein
MRQIRGATVIKMLAVVALHHPRQHAEGMKRRLSG